MKLGKEDLRVEDLSSLVLNKRGLESFFARRRGIHKMFSDPVRCFPMF